MSHQFSSLKPHTYYLLEWLQNIPEIFFQVKEKNRETFSWHFIFCLHKLCPSSFFLFHFFSFLFLYFCIFSKTCTFTQIPVFFILSIHTSPTFVLSTLDLLAHGVFMTWLKKVSLSVREMFSFSFSQVDC